MTDLVPRVLVVEDDDAWQVIIRDFLLHHVHPCAEVVFYTRFQEGRAALEDDQWDLAILDIFLLPNGPGLGNQLVAQARSRGIPTVVISGEATTRDVREYFKQFRILDFIAKRDFNQVVPEVAGSIRKELGLDGALGASDDVFVCYAHEDAALVEDLVRPLREHHALRLWIDREELSSGDLFERKIEAAIRGSKAAIVPWSRHLRASVFVTRFELPILLQEARRRRGLRLLWLRLDGSPVPVELEGRGDRPVGRRGSVLSVWDGPPLRELAQAESDVAADVIRDALERALDT